LPGQQANTLSLCTNLIFTTPRQPHTSSLTATTITTSCASSWASRPPRARRSRWRSWRRARRFRFDIALRVRQGSIRHAQPARPRPRCCTVLFYSPQKHNLPPLPSPYHSLLRERGGPIHSRGPARHCFFSRVPPPSCPAAHPNEAAARMRRAASLIPAFLNEGTCSSFRRCYQQWVEALGCIVCKKLQGLQ
jgi:hypothetical protein